MIYFDNSATTLQKPPVVLAQVTWGLQNFANSGRSFYQPAIDAARAVYQTRRSIADLVALSDPLQVAFTSGATESLNLVLNSLITPSDGVITTVLEHNSVLRPLYRIGCPLSVLDCDHQGNLLLDNLPQLLKANTRYLVCTHGSNLLGSITDTTPLYRFCQDHGLVLILDVAQTLGCIPVTVNMADILCFTGHKALFGPQGTGGIIAASPLPFSLVKTGGTGSDSFAPHQPLEMPDVFEAGTLNSHGLWGLQAGASFVAQIGIQTICKHEEQLTARFITGIRPIKGIHLFGSPATQNRLPVVSLLLKGMDSQDLSLQLWEGWQIATRPGSHCAPLLHQRLGTKATGLVRFSFSYFNTEEEIDIAISALHTIAGGCI